MTHPPGPANSGYTPLQPTPDTSGQFRLADMANPPRRKLWPWLLAAAVLLTVGVGGVGYWLTRPEPAPASSAKPTIAAAHTACEEAVKLRLKAPGSAKFGGREESAPNVEISIRVSGYVDAQNSFGALVRNRYSCLAAPAGATWSITDVSLSDWP